MILHAGLIAARLDGAWRGVLLEGASGCGKSDLALRAVAAGWRLVADDRALVWVSGGRLFGRAPDALAGLIEVRGLGVLAQDHLAFCQVALVVDLAGPIERLPEPAFVERAGVRLPAIRLSPLEASAPAKLGRALEYLGRGAEGAYQASPVARSLPRPGGDSH